MAYSVHEMFLTVQGEGANLGRVAVFVRFAGCNLWSGREEDRATALCNFCDTEFRGGERIGSAQALAEAASALWPDDAPNKMVVLTGGEPLLQVDAALLDALHARGFWIALETNGTLPLPGAVDFVCLSPKSTVPLALTEADELKLVYPQPDAPPERFLDFRARHFWLSPMDGPNLRANVAQAAAYCLAHPFWRLNIQAHKFWGLR
jgi:7-carboxy-7-deazaguanine synthase